MCLFARPKPLIWREEWYIPTLQTRFSPVPSPTALWQWSDEGSFTSCCMCTFEPLPLPLSLKVTATTAVVGTCSRSCSLSSASCTFWVVTLQRQRGQFIPRCTCKRIDFPHRCLGQRALTNTRCTCLCRLHLRRPLIISRAPVSGITECQKIQFELPVLHVTASSFPPPPPPHTHIPCPIPTMADSSATGM